MKKTGQEGELKKYRWTGMQ